MKCDNNAKKYQKMLTFHAMMNNSTVFSRLKYSHICALPNTVGYSVGRFFLLQKLSVERIIGVPYVLN